MKATIFKNGREVNNPFYVEIEKIVGRIRSGKHKDTVLAIRATSDKERRNELKISLPAIVFASAECTGRGNDKITRHSGYSVHDFDKLSERELSELWERLVSDEHTHLLFRSPSGNGLKLVIKIPADLSTHRDYCRGIKTYFGDEPSFDYFEDEARVCFESWDENCYFNPNSKVFEQKITLPKPEVTAKKTENIDFTRIYEGLKKWLDRRGDCYVDGNKHKYLVKLAGACNRFGLDEREVVEAMIVDFSQATEETVKESDFEKLVRRIYRSASALHGTAEFDEKGDIVSKKDEKKIDESVFDLSVPAKDIIYVNDIREQMLTGFDNGFEKAGTTHFPSIDPHFGWMKGEVTVMGGIGNHGKSSMMLQLMLIKSIKEGDKWSIFSPEQYPPVYFYNDLIHSYVGLSPYKFHQNQMSKKQYMEALDFMHEHFFYMYPENDSPTPDYINERHMECIIKHKVAGCMTDPFNQLANDWAKFGRDDQYLDVFLSKEKRFALEENVYKIIVAHPSGSLKKVSAGNYNEGNYECPEPRNLAGGAMWENKCDNILSYYRPFYSTDKTDTTCEFRSQKIKKQKIVGIPGNVTMRFDRMSNRFTEENGYSPFAPVETAGEKPAFSNTYLDSFTRLNGVSHFDKKDAPF
jgi:twinkle protein